MGVIAQLCQSCSRELPLDSPTATCSTCQTTANLLNQAHKVVGPSYSSGKASHHVSGVSGQQQTQASGMRHVNLNASTSILPAETHYNPHLNYGPSGNYESSTFQAYQHPYSMSQVPPTTFINSGQMAGISQTRWKAYSPAQPQTSGYSVSVPDYPEPADPISTLQLQHTSPAPPTARFSNTPSVAQAPGSSHQSASRQTTTPTTSAPTHTGQQKFSIVKYSKRLHEGEPAKVPSAAREHVKKKPAPQGQKYTTSAALIAQPDVDENGVSWLFPNLEPKEYQTEMELCTTLTQLQRHTNRLNRALTRSEDPSSVDEPRMLQFHGQYSIVAKDGITERQRVILVGKALRKHGKLPFYSKKRFNSTAPRISQSTFKGQYTSEWDCYCYDPPMINVINPKKVGEMRAQRKATATAAGVGAGTIAVDVDMGADVDVEADGSDGMDLDPDAITVVSATAQTHSGTAATSTSTLATLTHTAESDLKKCNGFITVTVSPDLSHPFVQGQRVQVSVLHRVRANMVERTQREWTTGRI